MSRSKNIRIETTLPKAWEEEQTFNDVLYDWMQRAPWLAISAGAHLVIFLIIQAIPWSSFHDTPEITIIASIDEAPEEIFEDPPEVIEPVEEVEKPEDPVLQEYEELENPQTDDDQPTESAEGDPDLLDVDPFVDKGFNGVIGIGGDAGGKYGLRFGGNRNGGPGGGRGTGPPLDAALKWLKRHQAADGSWDSDEFMHNSFAACGECDGAGSSTVDVGLTGLALLAFLGEGSTLSRGEYKDVISRGVQWLRVQQDPDTGLIGDDSGHSFVYNHAIATLALTEAYYFGKSPLIKRNCQKAVNYIMRARSPYGAWRYEVPGIGDADTSITGWMIFALEAARGAGLVVDEEALIGGMNWIDEVTDMQTGRVGYESIGSPSSRVTGINDQYDPQKGEALTAVGLLCRFFMHQDPKDQPVMRKHADLMMKKLPEWDAEGHGCDMYYWYYGSYAMYQMGGKYWKTWNVAMKKAVIGSMRTDGDLKGSWDPVGPWGHSGGRVYSTAMMALCLEVYFRYSPLLGAR